jgi:hypothetical protein
VTRATDVTDVTGRGAQGASDGFRECPPPEPDRDPPASGRPARGGYRRRVLDLGDLVPYLSEPSELSDSQQPRPERLVTDPRSATELSGTRAKRTWTWE